MKNVIDKIFNNHKGILAADESTPTIEKRLKSVGIKSTPENRHSYRHTIFSAPNLEKYIGGVILYDETIKNPDTIAPLKDKDIVLGIKVDKGVKSYSNSGKLTEGLDGLTERLREYKKLGAQFAKWRAVIDIKDTNACVRTNAWALSNYAKACQAEDIVPIVEPEVLMEGKHSIYEAAKITEDVLHIVFDSLYYEDINLEHIILKPNMILHGYDSGKANNPNETANITLSSFRKTVPSAVGAIAFLSGGQKDQDAINNLANINKEFYQPWILSFSFGRTMQREALQHWSNSNLTLAQEWIYNRATACSHAIEFGINPPKPDL